METYTPFSCDKCGLCCRYVNLEPSMQSYDRGDGVCRHLTSDMLCEIYDKRPPICDGSKVWASHFSQMPVAEFHAMTRQICDRLKEGRQERRVLSDARPVQGHKTLQICRESGILS